MSDTLYKAADDAMRALVYTKFKDLLGISDMTKDTALFPKDVAMRKIAEERGKTSVEFISVYRRGVGQSLDRQKTHAARRGIPITYTDDDQENVLVVKAQPCLFKYDVYFWSHSPDVLNAIDAEYIFWQQDDPNMDLTLTIGETEMPLELDLHFGDIDDESTVEMKYEKGVYYVHHASITMEMWTFDSTTDKAIQTIYLKCYESDPTTDKDTDVLLFERTITESN